MDDVTDKLKKIFSCKELKTRVCEKGMKGYFKEFKERIKDFLKNSKKSKNKKRELKNSKILIHVTIYKNLLIL